MAWTAEAFCLSWELKLSLDGFGTAEVATAKEKQMPIVEPSGGGYDGPEIPDGLYQVTCTKVEERELKNDKFGNTDKLQLTLAGVTPDGDPFTVEPLLNRKWGEKAALFEYAQAFGIDPDPHSPFDTDLFLRKKAQAFVVTGEEAGSWPRVQSISRVKSQKNGSAPSQTSTQTSAPQVSILTAEGTVNWDAFWRETKRLGLTRESVAGKFNGDLTQLTNMDGVDVAVWLQDLSEELAR